MWYKICLPLYSFTSEKEGLTITSSGSTPSPSPIPLENHVFPLPRGPERATISPPERSDPSFLPVSTVSISELVKYFKSFTHKNIFDRIYRINWLYHFTLSGGKSEKSIRLHGKRISSIRNILILYV
jgi:hypothetical protein